MRESDERGDERESSEGRERNAERERNDERDEVMRERETMIASMREHEKIAIIGFETSGFAKIGFIMFASLK